MLRGILIYVNEAPLFLRRDRASWRFLLGKVNVDGEVLVDPWAMRYAASFRPWLAGVNRRRMVEDSINILSMRRQMIF